MFLALIIALAMILPMAVPIAADNPPENKPVAWVSFAGSNANNKDVSGSHDQLSIHVKKLSDGRTVGFFNNKVFGLGEVYHEVIDSNFYLDTVTGAKVADVLVIDQAYGLPWYLWWRLVDGGEPGHQKDTLEAYIWSMYIGPDPFDPASYTWTSESYTWPPQPAGWPPVVGESKWYWYIWPPVQIVSGNIQVHLPD